MPRLKRILSNINLIFALPMRFFKKSKIDNFAFGVIFGAVFSLLVNVLTVQLQEIISRQRYYESVEQELIQHYQDATSSLDLINKKTKGQVKETFLTSFPQKYDRTIWDSGDALSYIQQLKPNAQARLAVHYARGVNFVNVLIDQYRQIYFELDNEYQKCLYLKNRELCNNIKNGRDAAYIVFENAHYSAAKHIYNSYIDTRLVFHPTQDRLENPLLRLLIGNEAIEILKKPKEDISRWKIK